MSIDSKEEFIMNKIRDLRSHFGSSKDTVELNGFVTEALWFAAPNNKTWKFWLCCYCRNLGFPDSESLKQHVKNSHVGNLSPELHSLLPQNVEDNWKPLDASAALKMPEDDQAKSKDTKNSEETNITESVEVERSVDASAAVKMLEDDQAKAKDAKNSEETNITEGVEGKSPMHDLPDISQNPEIKENIALNEDATCLVLNECLVSAEITPGATDPFLFWMFLGLSCRDELESFTRRKQYRRPQAMEIVQTLENEFNHLQRLSETKRNQKNYEEALQIVEDLCVEGKNFTELVLKRRIEELIKGENDAAVHVSNKFELKAITNVLEEADAIQKLNANLSGECDEEMIMDVCIEVAFEKLTEIQYLELGITGAQLLRSITNVKELELNFLLASGFDLRETLLPIVKLYLGTRLEDLGMKNATKSLKQQQKHSWPSLILRLHSRVLLNHKKVIRNQKIKGEKKQKGKTENLKKKKVGSYSLMNAEICPCAYILLTVHVCLAGYI